MLNNVLKIKFIIFNEVNATDPRNIVEMKIIFLFAFSFIAVFQSIAQNALNLDGVNDYVQTNFSGVSGNNARTVEAWINTSANCVPTNGGVQQVIADWGTSATGGRFTFNVLWGNAIRLEVQGSGVSGSIPVNDGNWHHVAAVYNPAAGNPVSLYVDGVLDIAGSLTVSVNTVSNVNMRIGQRVDGINHFTGSIDEVRVWNTAKTQSQLIASMNAELCNLTPDLQAYYTFNQGTAGGNNPTQLFLYDQTSNNNTGTLNNFNLNGATSNWVTGTALSTGFTTSTSTITACDQYTWTVNGQTYTSGGIYSTLLTSVSGCDSIATLDLTISSPNDLTTNATTCDAYTWSVNGQTYTTSQVIDTTLSNLAGCPYNHTLNITILNSSANTNVITTCDSSYTWIDGNTYTASTTTPTWTLLNAAGCDSVITLDLTINALSTAVTNNDPTLTVDQFGLSYQWIDCNNNFAIIPGETNQSFTPVQIGSYAVILSGNGCTDTSSCFLIETIGVDELNTSTKELIKITDLLGRDTLPTSNTPLLYIYTDGSIERRFLIED